MKATHEILIREYSRGHYDVVRDGRTEVASSRRALGRILRRLFDLPDDPELLKQIADLEQEKLDRETDV